MSDMNDALAAQILAEVRAVGAKVSGIEITVAQAVERIQHRSDQVDDHEDRIRALESSDNVTKADLEASQRERSRRTALVVSIVLALAVPVEAWLLSLIFS
jgi:hypothetical protein